MIRQLAGDTAVVAMVRALVSHFPTATLAVAPETVLQRLQVLTATGQARMAPKQAMGLLTHTIKMVCSLVEERPPPDVRAALRQGGSRL